MTRQLGSELLKLRTTRTVPALLLAAAALTLLGACVEGLSPGAAEQAGRATQRSMFAAGVTAVLFATFAGLIAVTGEFRYGTIRPTLLVQPRRRVVLGAKLTAAALVGVLFAVACVAVAFAAGLAILTARGVGVALEAGDIAPLTLGTTIATVMGALIGVAVGALIRNQAGAIVAVAAYAFAVDAVLFAAAPSVGRYLPGKAGDGLAGRPVDDLLAPGAGAAVLALWTLAFVAAAAWRTDHTDV
jgi:ABC-type transport system involved in multi-copper enzyme maturation permease subunit